MITASDTERGLVSETKYMVIDSDSHVVETERTWQFMDPGDEKHRPVLAAHPTDPHTQWWIINGQARGLRFPTLTEEEMAERSKQLGRDVVTPIGAREGDDVERPPAPHGPFGHRRPGDDPYVVDGAGNRSPRGRV